MPRSSISVINLQMTMNRPDTLGKLKAFLKIKLSEVTASPEQVETEIGLMLEHFLHLSPNKPWLNPEAPLSEAHFQIIESLLQKRVDQRIPIQYLTGQGHFFGLTLSVTPDVLIPRPETELLVEKSLELILAKNYRTVLDIGTGSGAIAIAIAHTLKKQKVHGVKITATDFSEKALTVAQNNAKALELSEGEISFHPGSLFEAVQGQQFDLILSNPPYIDPALKPTLAPEVIRHEPESALFAADAGYYFYEQIAQGSLQALTPGGSVLLELGQGMAQRTLSFFPSSRFSTLSTLQDYAGIERILVAETFH